MPSSARPALELRLHFEHHAVLVRLREDGRDEALAERVVERVVDRRRRDAEPARRVAVDVDVRLQALVLQVARDVGELAAAARSRSTSFGTHVASSSRFGVLERELVLRAADARLDRQVLHRLHVQRDAGDVGERVAAAGG